MKDATATYLQKVLKEETKVLSTKKVSEMFGYGTEDLVINQSGVLTDLAPNYSLSNILEFKNLTINEGCSVLGNYYSYTWRPFSIGFIKKYNVSDSRYNVGWNIATPVPFFLKVSGTLTVNGHLHMDGQGGMYCDDGHGGHTGQISSSIVYNPVANGRGWFYGDDCVPLDYWLDFYNYGLAKSFFNGQLNVCGAGASTRASWKSRSAKRKYDSRITSGPINGGGRVGPGTYVGHKNFSGRASGGFLALYYENLDYQGLMWEDNTTAITKGVSYPANINCNGGYGQGSNRNAGGGMMVIAAKNIVIGPNGSITCNPNYYNTSTSYGLITNINSADDFRGGGIAFLNRPPKLPLYNSVDGAQYQYQYNSGIVLEPGSGAAGICIGYKIKPEFFKPNR